MTKSRTNDASKYSGQTSPFTDGPPDVLDDGGSEFTRRSFLIGLGALALGGCGGESSESPPATRLLSGSLANTRALVATHPALLHTPADFTRMAQRYTTSPYLESWNLLIANPRANLSWTPRPQTVVYRGYDGVNPQNYHLLYNDVAAAYACALRWKISGDPAYAAKSVEIMNAWSSTLTGISGTTDHQLAAGIYGYEFANAGEIMRTWSGWTAEDFTSFKGMMRNIFYPINHDFLIRHNGTDVTHYWANWDLCAMASIMAIGVLCDEQALFDEAVTYFKSGVGNGNVFQSVYYMHPGHMGQWQESGRDQGHATLGIALMGALCEMAWNQGVDLYGFDNNRFLMGAEYVAKSNLIQSGTTYYSVPFVWYNNIHNVNHTALSTGGQGNIRPCWALVYNHYVNRKGLAAPYTKRFALLVQPEGGGGNYGGNSGGFDQLGYGTLTHTRDAIAAGSPPSGLTAFLSAGRVLLSWWGGAYATSYNVKRASASSGPWTTIRTGITDLLTYIDTPPAGRWYYIVTAITPSGETAASNQVVALTGMQMHTRLQFNENTGTVAADSSGNGRNGTLAGSAAWAAGRSGNAVSLNGTSAYVSLPANALRDMGDFTVACWVYWNAARSWERVFDFGSGTGRYMMLTPRAGNGLARFAITLNGNKGEMVIDSNAALPTGQWVHVAVTLLGATGTLYVNGVAVGTHTAMFHTPFQMRDTSRNWIGRSQYSGDPYFNGKIEDFRIYWNALTASEVANLKNTT